MTSSSDDQPYGSLVPPWDPGPDETLLETRIFKVSRHQARSRLRDRQANFFVLDTLDWVNVIARTLDGRVVLVEQYRHGTDSVTVEIPGGMVDPGEDALCAGLRELAEETGYRPAPDATVQVIGVVDPNPAIQRNRCTTVLVDGIVSGSDDPDPNEELAVRLVPQAVLPDLVRQGVITHALVVAALHHLALLEDLAAP
ncbi:MAG: NUDIX hydrolase [Oligoflexia bacterium]|nr:NUDIX hydrolase [Oligoflexia bacterium]